MKFLTTAKYLNNVKVIMKKFFILLTMCLFFVSGAFAQHRDRHGRVFYGHNWVAPVIISGALAYTLSRPQTIIVQDSYQPVQPDPTLIMIDGVVYQRAYVNVNGYIREVMIRQ